LSYRSAALFFVSTSACIVNDTKRGTPQSPINEYTTHPAPEMCKASRKEQEKGMTKSFVVKKNLLHWSPHSDPTQR
jgi:hypothetical protein